MMGGRGSSSGAVNHFVRQNALTWARSQIGSVAYAKEASLGKWQQGSWKCNAFVIQAFNQNTIPKIIDEWKNPVTMGITKRVYRAKDFYDGKVPGFKRVENPQAGDICADGVHVGIVSGKGKTISAAKEKIVENDWGFRKNAKRKSRFYRYVGIDDKK